MQLILPIIVIVLIIFLYFKFRSSIYLMKGANAFSEEKVDKALSLFEKAWKVSSKKTKYGMHYAYFLLKAGKLTESEQIFKEVFKGNLTKDEEMLLKSNYALVLWKKDELDKAIIMLEEVCENYKNSIVLGSLGYLLIQSKDIEKALEFNKMAYEYNDKDKIILDNYGNILFLTGQLVESLRIYEELEKLQPTFPDAYYNYGSLQLLLGNKIEAQRLFEKAMSFKISFLSTISKQQIIDKLEESKISD